MKRLTNLGDPKSEKDPMNLQNVKIILKDSNREVIKQQILTNQYLSEDINRFTRIYQSTDNILTKTDDKGLLVKNTLKATKVDTNAENKRITNIPKPKIG